RGHGTGGAFCSGPTGAACGRAFFCASGDGQTAALCECIACGYGTPPARPAGRKLSLGPLCSQLTLRAEDTRSTTPAHITKFLGAHPIGRRRRIAGQSFINYSVKACY